MRLLAFNQRHLRGPSASTPFSVPRLDALIATAGMLSLIANSQDHTPKNHLTTSFTFIAGSLGYAVLSPALNDFITGYAIPGSGRDESGSSRGFFNPSSPLKAVLSKDAAHGQDFGSSFVVSTYAPTANTGRTARIGGTQRGDYSQGSSSSGAQGDSTSRNARNNNQGSYTDGSTPPDGDRPRRSLRLANGKKSSTNRPPLRNKRNRARGGPPPPPPPPPTGTTPEIEDSSKGNNGRFYAFILGSLLLAGLLLSVYMRMFNSCKCEKQKKKKKKRSKKRSKKRKRVKKKKTPTVLDTSNATSATLDIVQPCPSTFANRINHAIHGLVPTALSTYCSNLKPAFWRLLSRFDDAVRALISATVHSVQPPNYGLSLTELHLSGDSLITETCKGTSCGGLTSNMSMQQALESVAQAGRFSSDDGVLRQTCRYLHRVLLCVSVVIVTAFTKQLLRIMLSLVQDDVTLVGQPISDPLPPIVGRAILAATPVLDSPGGAEANVDVSLNHALEVLEQIIPEATIVAEPENAVKLDTSIAPVLAESPLEEDDEVFIYPGFVMESTEADDSEIFIYPGFVPDVDGEHEQADDTDIFVYPGNSHTNDEDKDDSDCEVFIYPGTIDIDSAEPAVSNDVFGEVKVINIDSDSAISYVPVKDIGTSIHAPQDSTSSDSVGDTIQIGVVDKGKKKAHLDIEVEDPNVIVAVLESQSVVDSALPVFVAVPGHRRHRTRPKQRRKAWLARQAAAEDRQTVV